MINNIENAEPLHEECFMKDRCLNYNVCPMTLVQKLFTGKWKLLILWFLSSKTMRFGDIKKRIPEITQKMLTSQLRSLEEDRLICRHVYPEVPPRVEYSLTEVGRQIIPILESMHTFGSRYIGLVNNDSPNA